jgi:branched-chain amino acid transport system permease protein
MSRFAGPILGAVVLIWAQTLISNMLEDSNMFVGLLLLVIVIALPQGLVSLPGRVRRRRRTAPPAATPRTGVIDPAPDPVGEPDSAPTTNEEVVR